MSNTISNKEALSAILDGKIVKSPEGGLYKYTDKIMFLNEENEWVKAHGFNTHSEFKVVEPTQETITLYEHICDCGEVKFLTKSREYIMFFKDKNELRSVGYLDKCRKVYSNGVCREVKVYADTLEYVQEDSNGSI